MVGGSARSIIDSLKQLENCESVRIMGVGGDSTDDVFDRREFRRSAAVGYTVTYHPLFGNSHRGNSVGDWRFDLVDFLGSDRPGYLFLLFTTHSLMSERLCDCRYFVHAGRLILGGTEYFSLAYASEGGIMEVGAGDGPTDNSRQLKVVRKSHFCKRRFSAPLLHHGGALR